MTTRVVKATRWFFLVAGGLIRFVASDPKVMPAAMRWVVDNIKNLPEKTRRKTNIGVRQARIKEALDACRSVYAGQNVMARSADLNFLKKNYEQFGITRWGLLYVLIRASGSKTIIETGVAEGESSSHILCALFDGGGGTLHSVDMPNQFYMTDDGEVHAEFNAPDTKPGFLVPGDLRENWTLTLGRSQEVLPGVLREKGEIDIFFHDSEHTSEVMNYEFEAAWPYIRRGGYLISDDADWNQAMQDFADRHGVEAFYISGSDYCLGFIQKP